MASSRWSLESGTYDSKHSMICQDSIDLYSASGSFNGMTASNQPHLEPGTWIFREIPRELMRRAKAAAAIEGKSVRGLTIELMEAHLAELERKGLLSKSK